MENQIVKHKPSMLQVISEGSSKLALIEKYGTLTLKQIVNEKPPTIGALITAEGKEKVGNAMAVIIADLSQSFGGDLNKDDIQEIVTELRVGITKNLSLEDVYLMCRNLKVSDVHKLKAKTVIRAAQKHLEERSNMIANMNYEKHVSTKFEGERSSDKSWKPTAEFIKVKAEYEYRRKMKSEK